MSTGDVIKVKFAGGDGEGPDDTVAEPFDTPVRGNPFRKGEAECEDELDADALVVNIDGFEGPLDVLLALARTQKVDLRKIAILQLVEQYLAFVEEAKARRLELAADYLVMASWLTYLKSRLLLPPPETEGDEPTGDEMAAMLAFQLQRLDAMRAAAEAMMDLPRFEMQIFPRGAPEGVRVRRKAEWTSDLYDLLRAYSDQRVRTIDATYKPPRPKVFNIEEARQRLERILGVIPDWSDLFALTQQGGAVDAPTASVKASAFSAALEFAKSGKLQIRQTGDFAPIYIRSPAPSSDAPTPAVRTGGEG